MSLSNREEKSRPNRPLKRHTSGLETEMHLIDQNGAISFNSRRLIRKVKKLCPEVSIVKECGKNMVEFGCYPNIYTYNPAIEMIESIEKTMKVAKDMGLLLYPFGTYPGNFEAEFTKDRSGKYSIKKKIFGEKRFSNATKVTGFHYHFALPRGVFNYRKKDLRLLFDSKLKRSLMNSYNFLISIDPVLTLFLQSSPFFDGRQLAKDSRLLVYRGGNKLNYMNGVYANHQQLGGLPPYKQTETDLIESINRRKLRFERTVREVDPKFDTKKAYPYRLDMSWNAVRVNKHGTLEQRGMDMNYISVVLGASVLIKFCLKKIMYDFIEVIPGDVGIKKPFRIRDGILYIPPHTYVRRKLQKYSAIKGFENDELLDYASKFFRFSKKLTPKRYYPVLRNISKMIKKRKSVSDHMISYAEKEGLVNKKHISNENASVLALRYSKLFERDLLKSKKMVGEIAEKYKMDSHFN